MRLQSGKLNPTLGSLATGWLLAGWLVAQVACSKSEGPATPAASEAEKVAMIIQITSSAFSEGNPIPVEYTCDGSDVSPDLKWASVPANAKSLALVCEDPDAPSGTFVHWVIWGIAPGDGQLAKSTPATATLASGGRQGRNGFGTTGYRGPCPPKGAPHRYFFRLYALDTAIDEPPGASREQVDRAMKGHIIAEGHLMGMYQRK